MKALQTKNKKHPGPQNQQLREKQDSVRLFTQVQITIIAVAFTNPRGETRHTSAQKPKCGNPETLTERLWATSFRSFVSGQHHFSVLLQFN